MRPEGLSSCRILRFVVACSLLRFPVLLNLGVLPAWVSCAEQAKIPPHLRIIEKLSIYEEFAA